LHGKCIGFFCGIFGELNNNWIIFKMKQIKRFDFLLQWYQTYALFRNYDRIEKGFILGEKKKMISYLRGKLASIQDEAVIVDVNGIGYEVICPNPFIFQDYLNTELHIHTYLHVREDAQILYGFKNKDQKYLFTKLLSVSGIGPKGALAILASVNIPEFVAAVEREDDKFLTSFPGVGKKTARQIILDLKGKLTTTFNLSVDEIESATKESVQSNEFIEAIEALKALGYMDREVKAILPQLKKNVDNKTNTDDIIRKALSLLMKK
jgi:holliday junction DNA helicase RuvA